MPGIDRAFLDEVLARLAVPPAPTFGALAQALRAAFPGRHISVCGEDDISPRLAPAAENAVALIYYVAAGDHCLSLTSDPAAATGIVVALRDPEEI